mmetsp:Transcript_73447/g.215412  ORF Transcript_73447/g.215412 Transcript_73447/m.215412 type:complete len:734 (-) Transcript_73447:43-2244(-)
MGWEAWVVLFVLFSALGCLYMELAPPDQVMLAALVLVWQLGLVTTKQAFAGFSNSSLITIACLFIVARAVDRSKVVDRFTRGLLGQKTTERGATFRLCVTGMALSGFLNNTPLVALLLPIVRDWARSRRFAASKFLLPLSYSTIMGGLLTIIGSSTNLVVNGLLEQLGHEPFGFFEPALVSLPVGLVALAYLVGVVPSLLPGDRGGLFRALREVQEEMVTELELTQGFPLLGERVFDALDELGIEKGALVKVLRRVPGSPRKPKRGSPTVQAQDPEQKSSGDKQPLLSRMESWGDDCDSPGAEEGLAAGRTAIFPVPEHEVALEGDVLVLSLAEEVLTALVARRPMGLQVKQLHPLAVAGDDEFVEVVLAPETKLIGLPISQGSEAFRRMYGVALIAVRPRHQLHASGADVTHKADAARKVDTSRTRRSFHLSPTASPEREASDAFTVSAISETSFFSRRVTTTKSLGGASLITSRALHHISTDLDEDREEERREAQEAEGRFAMGDIALVLAPKSAELSRTDFLLVTRVAGMPAPISRMDLLPLVGFCIGLALTIIANVSMLRVAMTLSVLCMLGGWVQPREVRDTVDWHLLILIGSALGLAQAVQTSGLSGQAAAAVQAAGLPPAGALALLFLMVMTVTELVTNNAAAALGLPLAVDLAKELGMASPRPFAMAVMLAASTSYACPIGYATNLMVLGPGGYTFRDFLRVGLVMDCIYWVGCSLVLPLVWPLA